MRERWLTVWTVCYYLSEAVVGDELTVPSDKPDADQAESVGSTVAEETTRVSGVQYLEGASGHGIGSLGLLLLAAVLFVRDLSGPAIVAGIVAYGVALNGLSIYVWDKLRAYFQSVFAHEPETTERTLTPHRISSEMKSEMASGGVMIGGLIVFLLIGSFVAQNLSFRQTMLLAYSGLALSNLAALLWAVIGS